MKLADLQAQFQRAILEGRDDILAAIPNSPRETNAALFDVYRNAYILRLIEILQSDVAHLYRFLGDKAFDRMARDYFAAHPSRHRNARWVGIELPAYLRSTRPYSGRPVLADLAALEFALNAAFDAADAPVLAVADLGQVAPDDWANLVFVPHPSAQRLDLQTNASAIWIALAGDKSPPKTQTTKTGQSVLVWRQVTTPKFRALKAEESMMWTEAAKGVRFSVLCEMLAAYDDPEGAAMRAATYLRTWVESGALSAIRVDAPVRKRRPPV